MATRKPPLMLSCEHAGYGVPPELRQLFAGAGRLLRSHRGWDPGALAVARELARRLAAPLVASEVSRLVIDLNRSLHHARVFSSFTRELSAAERQRLIERHYLPYRRSVADLAQRQLKHAGRVRHFSIHSFTPLLDGEVRNAEIGLLYDPRRRSERELANELRSRLLDAWPELRVRRNYPYRGAADGLTTALRKQLGTRYTGVEIELNQRLLRLPAGKRRVNDALVRALQELT